ncbi:phospholipase A1-like [Arctopsyche grandis]|uniref:phospholipase A1-like n=1 Tax=Arctopsyche grandis TaxID=121162 RepID=UPI00406D7F42
MMMKIQDFGLHLPFNNKIKDDLDTMSIIWHTPSESLKFKKARHISQKFDFEKPTVLIIHGFQDEPASMMPLSLAYHDYGSYNVLLVDAKNVITGNYIYSADMTQYIGKMLSEFLIELFEFARYDPKRVQLVGMSLGAHVAGWTGYYYKVLTKTKLGRITGIDPAGPCFSNNDLTKGLYRDHADFVDIIHTNKGLRGMVETLGHVDFFVNGGGPNQPGCSESSCSHGRAFELYLQSVRNSSSLVGRRCGSLIKFSDGMCNDNNILNMGLNSSTNSRGQYYLKTSSAPPFALGLDGCTI